MKLVWKLLQQNISKPQLFGFFFANLIGLSIVLLAIQFYLDISPIFSEKDKLFKEDYITITKEIGLLNTVANKSTNFSFEEIEEIKKQGFVKNIGAFTPSQFNVFAGINNSELGVGLNTEMFFESVPDKFVDVKTDEWFFSKDGNKIPIILPKNYLDIYNFGFAESNGTPKLTEGLINLIEMDIVLYAKNGLREQMKGNIVGFSNRINTILVPQDFMDWANKKFGNGIDSKPSRLLLEINNITDPNLATYFKDKRYVVSGENTAASKMSFFLKIIVGIVAAIGFLICLLSFFILTLSIYLLLEKNMSKLRILRLIGYKKSTVVMPYELLSVGLNFIILLLSLCIVYLIRDVYQSRLDKLLTATEQPSLLFIIGSGVLIFTLLSVLNIVIIRNKVK